MTVMAGAFNGRTCGRGTERGGERGIGIEGRAILWSWSGQQLRGCIAVCVLSCAWPVHLLFVFAFAFVFVLVLLALCC